MRSRFPLDGPRDRGIRPFLAILIFLLAMSACGGDDASTATNVIATSPAAASPATGTAVRPDELTLDEAVAAAPFALAVPSPVPDGIVFARVDTTTDPVSHQIARMVLIYRSNTEGIGDIAVETTIGGSVRANPTRTTESTVTIGGRSITKLVAIRADASRWVLYGWSMDDRFVTVSAVSPTPETDAEIERLVAALIN